MWRGFIDEVTPDGVHIIFTDDDKLTTTTIKDEYSGSGRKFGEHYTGPKVQSEIVTYVQRRVEELNAQNTPIVTGVFVDAPAVDIPAIDAKHEAEIALRQALSEFELAQKIQAANPSYDLTKYKQAVVDAKTALDAVGK